MNELKDVIIVGAGPIGLQSAILAKRAQLDYLVLEKGALVNAIYRYPTYMTFFTTAERLEIGGHPFVTATQRSTRKESTDYYRKVVDREQLNVKLYHEVVDMQAQQGHFVVVSRNQQGQEVRYKTRKVVLATGYFDNPKMLGVAGEDLPNVSHYYTEAHPFYNRPVTIIGAGSSAADAALDLYRGGAKVTMIHRGADFKPSLKYWIRPDLENRVKEGAITAHFNSVVKAFTPTEVIIEKKIEGEKAQELAVPSVQTFALTGYFAAPTLLHALGVTTDAETLAASLDRETFESNVAGVYLIGSAGFGVRTSEVFIENGIVHAEKAMRHLVQQLEQEKRAAHAVLEG